MDEGIARKGQLSSGGECWRGQVDVVDLGPCKSSTSEVWERAIKEAGEGRLVVYTDGSRDCSGQVGGGWYAPQNGAGCKWGSGLLKSRLCFLTSKNHKQDYKQRGTTTWG